MRIGDQSHENTQKEHAQAQFAKSALKQSHFTVTYRGCAEAGLCYPPVTVKISL